MTDPVLVLGGDALIGRALADWLPRQGHAVIKTTRRPAVPSPTVLHLDLTADVSGWRVPPACRVAIICFGITNLEQCRREPERTRHINVEQTAIVARALVAAGCFVIYLSSNHVFDGSQPWPGPGTPVSPMTEYGRQKVEAESRLLELGDQMAVVRMTKIFPPSPPLIQAWMRSLKAGQAINPYDDYRCAPVSVEFAVNGITAVAARRQAGIWHISGSEDITYAEIARFAAHRQRYDPALVLPISARSNPGLEHLPAYSTLDASRLRDELGLSAPDVRKTLEQILQP